MTLNLTFNKSMEDLYNSCPLNLYMEAHQRLLTLQTQEVAGFLNLPWTASSFASLTKTVNSFRKRFPKLLVLGIGGSSLGAQALIRALPKSDDVHRVVFWDNIDPDEFYPMLADLNIPQTAIYVVSKSGNTAETWAQWLAVEEVLRKAVGPRWTEHVALCTDPKKGELRALAQKYRLPVFSIPETVGGRYSALTPVALFPAAFAGWDPEIFLKGARTIGAPKDWIIENGKKPKGSLVALAARALFGAYKEGISTHVLMSYCQRLDLFCDWYVQLWAESLGKMKGSQPTGSTPIKALGVKDQHSQMQLFMQGPRDKVLGFLWNSKTAQNQKFVDNHEDPNLTTAQLLDGKSMRELFEAEYRATGQALEEADRPTYAIEISEMSPANFSQLLFAYQGITALCGLMMGINPLDQPGVERAKILTKERLTP